MKASYSNKEKIKNEKLIEKLFAEGKSISVFPLRLVYMETAFKDGEKLKTGVSVSKRKFKKAVDRNRIKRLLREAYRLEKSQHINNINAQYALMVLYIGNNVPSFNDMVVAMKKLFGLFLDKVSNKKSI